MIDSRTCCRTLFIPSIGKALAIVTATALLGCGADEEIHRYQAQKINAPEDNGQVASAEGTERMIAAIVPDGETAWFFKMVGPKDAVQEHADRFGQLIRSLEFVGGKPQWSLPDGWSQKPATGIRFATLRMKAADTDLDLSVISLSKPAGDDLAYNLANINRWRGQLQLSPLTSDSLPDESEQIDFKGGTAVLVDMVGKSSSSGGMSHPPFAGMNPSPRPDPIKPSTGSALKFEKPDGWEVGELVVSRGGITLKHEAAFVATDGDRQVDITVDRMPLVSTTLANVNRWRRQVGLSPWDNAAFHENVKQIEVAGEMWDYVQLPGAEQSILAAIAKQNDHVWYIKLKGEKDLATAQRERFEAFVNSIRFE